MLKQNVLNEITEIKPGSYTGVAILQNGTKVYLAFSNDNELRDRVYTQFANSINAFELFYLIKGITKKKDTIDLEEKKKELFNKFKEFFEDKQQFEKIFDDFYYNQKKLEKFLKIIEVSEMTFKSILMGFSSKKGLEIFIVCASTAPINISNASCPLLFSDRNIFMAMNCIMKINEPNSISVNHYGIVRDPSSLLGLTAPTDHASMLLHGFSAYVSLTRYSKYLQVNAPLPEMLKIIDKSSVKIYRSKEELLAESALPEKIRSYLNNLKILNDLDHSSFAALAGWVAIKLDDLSKEYKDRVLLASDFSPSSTKLKSG